MFPVCWLLFLSALIDKGLLEDAPLLLAAITGDSSLLTGGCPVLEVLPESMLPVGDAVTLGSA